MARQRSIKAAVDKASLRSTRRRRRGRTSWSLRSQPPKAGVTTGEWRNRCVAIPRGIPRATGGPYRPVEQDRRAGRSARRVDAVQHPSWAAWPELSVWASRGWAPFHGCRTGSPGCAHARLRYGNRLRGYSALPRPKLFRRPGGRASRRRTFLLSGSHIPLVEEFENKWRGRPDWRIFP